jgi:hypothetical protein
MAVLFAASSPSKLLRAFKDAIDDGAIDTWKYNEEGDLYHADKQFRGQAWFRPRLSSSSRTLTFNILRRKGGKIDSFVYAYYHGHLALVCGLSKIEATSISSMQIWLLKPNESDECIDVAGGKQQVLTVEYKPGSSP